MLALGRSIMGRRCCTAAVIASAIAIAAPARADGSSGPNAWEDPRAHDRDVAVWVEPIGSGLLGAARIFYLSAGANVVLDDRIELVPEAAFTAGNWYGADTTQLGTWLSLGLSFHTGERPLEGFFLLPKLRTRIFHTPKGGQTRGWWPSSVSEGTDVELGLGLDFGYEWSGRDLPLYFVFVMGLNGGVCIECHDDGLAWFGSGIVGRGGRSTRGVFGVNLNFLRMGVAF